MVPILGNRDQMIKVHMDPYERAIITEKKN